MTAEMMRIQVAELPEVTRSRLSAAVKVPPQDTFVISESRLLWALCGIIVVLLCVFFVLMQADGYRWQSGDRFSFLLLMIASFVIGWISLAYLIDWLRNDFKAHALLNPLYFLRFRFDHIEAFSLASTKNWDVKHLSDSRGVYTGTKFYFRSAAGQQILKIKSLSLANDLIIALRRFPSYVSDLVQRQDTSVLYSFDLLYEWRVREEQFPRLPVPKRTALAFVLKRIGPALLAALLATVVFFGAIDPYNDYRDDELRWRTAQSASTATAYRLYLASRPDGHHLSQAHAAISKLYEQAAESYRSAAGVATSQGIEAVIRILEFARSSGRYKVFVQFAADNQIPTNIEDRLRSLIGVSQVIPVRSSFTPSMNQARETRILGRITNSFGKVIPGDILQFAVGRASPPDIAFNVAYVIRASGGMYYPEKQEHVPEARRDWYTGISFDWNFYITVPGTEFSTFQLSLESEPAQLFHVAYTRSQGQGTELTPTEVYSAMADSAFDDFGSKLLSQLAVK